MQFETREPSENSIRPWSRFEFLPEEPEAGLRGWMIIKRKNTVYEVFRNRLSKPAELTVS